MPGPFSLADLAPLSAGLFKLWALSLRFDHGGEWDQVTRLHLARKPVILCIWHSELLALAAYGWRIPDALVTVISQSKDGEIIARMVERLGYAVARGSSTRGGLKALLRLARIMRAENRMAVLTVDGPKGPRHEPKPGAVFLARQTGAAIIPVRAYPSRKWVFTKSWDRFEVPKPFARIQVRAGQPWHVADGDPNEAALARETGLLRERLLALEPK